MVTGAGQGEHGWWVGGRRTDRDVARLLAPGLIGEVAGRSEVLRRSRDAAEAARLHTAAHACPTRSVRPPGGRPAPARDPFPMPRDDGDGVGTVLPCGHDSPHTAGADSYLLRRPDGTSMTIGTPRRSPALAARHEAPGPVTDVLLTHRDHAAHGSRYTGLPHEQMAARLAHSAARTRELGPRPLDFTAARW
ncbi:hypothetical protein GCM10011578_010030 [Streptomyces fuscichromogenes]|uniref:Uncharacterized protein n=1 Tax=Streptomyces fuscichromogenes TaxID=1324013 RepID=A0A917UJ97_9ACTN|nr:hypothetical protein GCM10011578_010030 [Streptomyces fuscichromogenes]